jgi:hypothetical protein
MYDRGYSKNQISGWRYRELKAILMQYDERAAKIADAINLPASIPSNTKATGMLADPTARAAERIARLKEINDKIDKVMQRIDQGKVMRKCLGYNRAVLAGYKGTKNEYYDNKRLMFVLLDKAFS